MSTLLLLCSILCSDPVVLYSLPPFILIRVFLFFPFQMETILWDVYSAARSRCDSFLCLLPPELFAEVLLFPNCALNCLPSKSLLVFSSFVNLRAAPQFLSSALLARNELPGTDVAHRSWPHGLNTVYSSPSLPEHLHHWFL